MGKYLQLAEQALQKDLGVSVNEEKDRGAVRSTQPTSHSEQSELSEKSPRMQVHVLRRKLLRERRGELRRAAGDDWDELSVPAKIIGFADSLATEQIREGGSVPDHYTGITKCKRCGTVPIFPGCPPIISGCPWCFNRLKGLPIPRAPHCEEYDNE